MACDSFYDVLQVPGQATLDEIKLAFRRRALQVHPDKGGSKEAFHRVYQALETLSDPEARKKYDQWLISPTPSKGSKGKGQASAHREEGKKQKTQPPQKPTSGASGKSFGPENGGSVPKGKDTLRSKMMKRIRTLLQKLPRDLRFQVISQDFSQKQRVLFQRWMENIGVDKQAADAPDMTASSDSSIQISEPNSHAKSSLPNESCNDLAVPTSLQSPKLMQTASCPKSNPKKPCRNSSGVRGVCRRDSGGRGPHTANGNRYRAHVFFDGVSIFSRNCALSTALDYLLILTSAKQKALDQTFSQGSLEERLEKAFVSSAQEHGRDCAELKLRFVVSISCQFLLGRKQVESPVVHSLQELKTLRSCMESFWERVKPFKKTSNIFEHLSPHELQEIWEDFQAAVARMFQSIGADHARCLRQVNGWHSASDRIRATHMQRWERRRMPLHDKRKHTRHLNRANFYGKRIAGRVRRYGEACDKQVALRKLLKTWQRLLVKEEQSREKLRRKILRQRKKEQEAQKRAKKKQKRS